MTPGEKSLPSQRPGSDFSPAGPGITQISNPAVAYIWLYRYVLIRIVTPASPSFTSPADFLFCCVDRSLNSMTSWRDPVRIFADYIALLKFIHVLGGLYIWEFVMNLDYEYSIFTGQRKRTRVFPLYLGCRWCPLVVIAMQFLGTDGSYELDCPVFIGLGFGFGAISFLFASALIILRICALWQQNKVVIAIASASWLADLVTYIYSTVNLGGGRIDGICAIRHTMATKISIVTTFVTDLVLLILMLIGVLRWKEQAKQSNGIWRLLYTHGLIWVVVFTLAEVPPMVFITLNLNDPMNILFLTPGLIITSLSASRLHRKLADFQTINPGPTPQPVASSRDRSRSTKSCVTGPEIPRFFSGSAYAQEDAALDSDTLP
ncbi:hypothetical protein BGW80DRAFT_1282665 [Lactifluus volemus]|nr:hypothetical protein BGW80DRAFT_1282665 [Lactifluus volemus]